ncbi:hypothetical protein O1Q96_19790 [Streptomyces sp. Qhu-G9]|uniref:hypothetical protein n=1 Tax=Streptomyces sp. Qhu-G9 TaxID=3452799 RepID=UPI0022AC144F|nr:hypothetical protein [Streptomyces aurantiacus]WAU81827.1 hypothetical protein O1Q96_19790 [Streptomyces aurantiacus]
MKHTQTDRSEKRVVRIDDLAHVDFSDVVTDFDATFSGTGGIDRGRPVVAE